MNTVEKLEWLRENTCSLHIEVNDHRSCYQSITAFVDDDSRYGDMEEDVRAECVKRDQVVLVQVYPNTPVGFFSIAHYDLAIAIDRAHEAVTAERRGK